jgi:hypothetical protein
VDFRRTRAFANRLEPSPADLVLFLSGRARFRSSSRSGITGATVEGWFNAEAGAIGMGRGEESAPASPIASGLVNCTSTVSDRLTSLAKRKMQKHIKAAKIKMPERGAYSTSALCAGLWVCFVSMRHQVAWRRFNRWPEISRCDPGGTSDEGWHRSREVITTGAGEGNGNQRRAPLRPIVFQFPFRKVRNHVRISSVNNSGSSIAAKWPPRAISVQRCTLKNRSAHSRGG